MENRYWELTRNYIPSIKCIIVLDEAEAVHELDLGNVPSTILEVVLDVFLRDCGSGGQRVPSELLKTPVGMGDSITDPFEARGLRSQTLNKAERKENPSSVAGSTSYTERAEQRWEHGISLSVPSRGRLPR